MCVTCNDKFVASLTSIMIMFDVNVLRLSIGNKNIKPGSFLIVFYFPLKLLAYLFFLI